MEYVYSIQDRKGAVNLTESLPYSNLSYASQIVTKGVELDINVNETKIKANSVRLNHSALTFLNLVIFKVMACTDG